MKRIPESSTDDFEDGSNWDIEPEADTNGPITGQPKLQQGDETYFHAGHDETDLQQLFLPSILQAVARDSNCTLAINDELRCIAIIGSHEMVAVALRRLSNLERNSVSAVVPTSSDPLTMAVPQAA